MPKELGSSYPNLSNKALLHLIKARDILIKDLEERVNYLETITGVKK
jgi:hypothetical protein